jgi:glycosyltransferase involved in cell wall biosynthesis
MPKNSKISVVIPFYNAEKTLKLCLDGVCRQSVLPEEIILVDNNSTDNSKNIAKSFIKEFYQIKITYTFCGKEGPSATRNKGANLATEDWLLFTDSDCVPSFNWISDYLTHLDEEGIDAVAGCIKPYPPSNLIQKTLSIFTLPENQEEIIHSYFSIGKGLYPAANLAIRRDVFSLVGGFNESLIYGEDHELCYKIYESGHKIKAVTDAAVEHIHRKSLRKLIRQSFGFGTAHPYELRHFTPGALIFISPILKIRKIWPTRYVWIDLDQADKKIVLFFLAGFVWWPFYILLPAYFLHLCLFIHRIAAKKKIIANAVELPCLASLLILKSLCQTCGRLLGSTLHRVVCI